MKIITNVALFIISVIYTPVLIISTYLGVLNSLRQDDHSCW